MFDSNMSFFEETKAATDKAATVVSTLRQLMVNVGDPIYKETYSYASSTLLMRLARRYIVNALFKCREGDTLRVASIPRIVSERAIMVTSGGIGSW